MAAADVSTVNLETVVGQLPASGAYPAKRFLLQSPPVVLAALHDMGIDLVSLGNNHAYDWQGPGVASTISALDGSGIAWAGAGTTAEQAQAGRMIDVGGTKVGVVSATTVNGDFVNDNLPGADEDKPVRRSTTRLVAVRGTNMGVRKAGRPGVRAHRTAPCGCRLDRVHRARVVARRQSGRGTVDVDVQGVSRVAGLGGEA